MGVRAGGWVSWWRKGGLVGGTHVGNLRVPERGGPGDRALVSDC